jgi:hypothetical protein
MINQTDIAPRTPRETSLIAAHVQRATELRTQMDLLLLRGLVREVEEIRP